MADVMRWRYGDTNPVVVPVDASTVIEIGDLVSLNVDDARPASLTTYGGSLAAAQENFHDQFLGVAMQRSPSGSTAPIRVATSGVFEFDCAAATFEIGARLGVDDNAGGTALEDQQLIAVAAASPQLSIGICVRRVNPADTRVLVDLVSTVLRGGPQAPA
jgi:hypothetical protein